MSSYPDYGDYGSAMEDDINEAHSERARFEKLAAELYEALRAANRILEEELDRRDGEVSWAGCPNCDGAVPMAHSDYCAVQNALLHARKA